MQRTPNAVALIQGDHKLTYIQLNEQANRLANYLRKRGVGPEVLVGFCMEQSLERSRGSARDTQGRRSLRPPGPELSGTPPGGDRLGCQARDRRHQRPIPAIECRPESKPFAWIAIPL